MFGPAPTLSPGCIFPQSVLGISLLGDGMVCLEQPAYPCGRIRQAGPKALTRVGGVDVGIWYLGF